MDRANFYFRNLVAICSLSLFLACERQAKDITKLSIHFPNTELASANLSSKVEQVNATASGSSNQFASIVPTGFSGAYPFNCFGFFASGPEAELRSRRCMKKDTGVQMVTFGPFLKGFPANSTGEFEVSSGGDRVIGVFGVWAQDAAACDAMKHEGFDKSKMSKPYILGEVGRLNLPAGETVNIAVPLSFDSNRWFDKCDGIEFGDGTSGGGGDTPAVTPMTDFGTGADGSLSVLTPVNSDSVMTNSGRKLNPSYRVVVYSDDKHLTLSTSPLNLQVNDEVLITNIASWGTNPETVCGGNIAPGTYRFAKIKSIASSTLEFYDSTYDVTSPPVNNAAISNFNPDTGDYCDIRVVRVAHLNNVTISGSGKIVTPTSDWTSSTGVIAMRVKGTLTLGSSISLKATTGGFQPGSTVSDFSSGTFGKRVNGSAGQLGSYPGSLYFIGGAGGANFGYGGAGISGQANLPYNRSFANNFCMGPCSLQSRLFMGGAGGNGYLGTGIGGAGGGLILVFAYNVVTTMATSVEANGGAGSVSPSNGPGGGGGGSIIFRANTIIQNGGALYLSAKGGDGSTISTGMGTSFMPGGGGGGGGVLFNYCSISGGGGAVAPYTVGGSGGFSTDNGLFGEAGGFGLSVHQTEAELCHDP